MKKVDVKTLTDNFFETIGREWMLVTAGGKDSFNMMTASWGCVGWLWNMPVAVIFIRPERFTHGFIERDNMLTLSFLGHSKEAREAYNVCGSRSGRDCDKLAASGLSPVVTEAGNVTFAQARLTLECRKLYHDALRPECFADSSLSQWYGAKKGGFHDVYVLEIVNALVSGD